MGYSLQTVLVCLVTYLHSNSIHTRFLSPLNFVLFEKAVQHVRWQDGRDRGCSTIPRRFEVGRRQSRATPMYSKPVARSNQIPAVQRSSKAVGNAAGPMR